MTVTPDPMTPDELAEARYDINEDAIREGIATGDLDDRGRIPEWDEDTDGPRNPCGICGMREAGRGLTACGWCA